MSAEPSRSTQPDQDQATLAETADELERVFRGGDRAKAIAVAETALARLRWIPFAVDPAARGRCIVYAAAIFTYNERAREGEELAEVAIAIARRLGDAPTLRKALTVKGVALSFIGRPVAAIPPARECLEIGRRLSPHDERAALINLSSILIDLGLFRDAIGVLEWARKIKDPTGELELVHNIATCWLNLREYVTALKYHDEALSLANTKGWEATVDPTAHVLFWSTRLRIQWGMRELAGVRQSLEHVRVEAKALGTARANAIAAMCEAILKLAEKKHSEGLSAAEAARDLARRYAPSFEAVVVQSLIKGYVDTKQLDRAVALQRELATKYKQAWEKILDDCRAITRDTGYAGVGPPDDLFEFSEDGLAARAGRNRTLEALDELAYTSELADDVTGLHGYRVAKLAAALATRIGMEDEEVAAVQEAAKLHDVGKVTAPRGLMQQKAPLSEKERVALEAHAASGAEFIERAGPIPNAELITLVVRHHHERWDGRGYPSQLAGENIPLAARIVALADVYDALTHEKAYRKAWTHDQAMAEIAYLAGQQFDPNLVTPFLEMLQELHATHPDLESNLTAEAFEVPFIASRRAIQRLREQLAA